MSTGDHWGLVGREDHYPPSIGKIFVSLLEVIFGEFGASFVLAINGVKGICVNDSWRKGRWSEGTCARLGVLEDVNHCYETLSGGLGQLMLVCKRCDRRELDWRLFQLCRKVE